MGETIKKDLKIGGKTITLIYKDSEIKQLPAVILNTVNNEGEQVWKCSKKLNCKPYILVSISDIDWNHDMSPWAIDKISRSDTACTGGADDYIKILVNEIIPEVKRHLEYDAKEFILAGYSLAGLFAIYSLYKTDIFTRIVSGSGSFWYPNFKEFVKSNELKNKPQKIYFSLGNQERKTTNKILNVVEENTKWLEKYYNSKGIDTIYLENDGNHFQDANLRMAKGIKWILE